MGIDTLKYIDLSKIKKECLGDTEFMTLFIQTFLKGFEEFIETAKRELKLHNWQNVFAASHKIKPTVILFGIRELVPLIHLIVERSRNKDQLHTIQPLVLQCKKIFIHVRKELQNELQHLRNEKRD